MRANNSYRVSVDHDVSEQSELLDALQNQLETDMGDDEDSDEDDDADDGMVGVAGGGWESVTTEQIVASQVKISLLCGVNIHFDYDMIQLHNPKTQNNSQIFN